MEKLIEQRQELTDGLAGCARGAFPGSAQWHEEQKWLVALADFDNNHPEVLPEIDRRKSTAPENVWND